MYKIMVTNQAAKELERIADYIAINLSSPLAALDLVEEVDEYYARLENTPYMCELCRDEKLKSLGYHRAVIKNYVFVYRVDDTTEVVHVLHFFHGTQAYERLI